MHSVFLFITRQPNVAIKNLINVLCWALDKHNVGISYDCKCLAWFKSNICRISKSLNLKVEDFFNDFSSSVAVRSGDLSIPVCFDYTCQIVFINQKSKCKMHEREHTEECETHGTLSYCSVFGLRVVNRLIVAVTLALCRSFQLSPKSSIQLEWNPFFLLGWSHGAQGWNWKLIKITCGRCCFNETVTSLRNWSSRLRNWTLVLLQLQHVFPVARRPNLGCRLRTKYNKNRRQICPKNLGCHAEKSQSRGD